MVIKNTKKDFFIKSPKKRVQKKPPKNKEFKTKKVQNKESLKQREFKKRV
ncbi:hypothetical protein HMPREF1398_01365 [Helicobacter pylori GAM117Ai]|nr:hypothetical protein HMPREF1398_01365 [Helicobacter pylori GAM117Ai]